MMGPRMRLGPAAVLVALACSGADTTAPPPGLAPPAGVSPASGWVDFRLETPNQDDGALLLTVVGGTVDSVEAATGYEVYTLRRTSDVRVLVTGALVAGPLLRIRIPDAPGAGAYSARVEQVAARAASGYVLRDATGYSVAGSR